MEQPPLTFRRPYDQTSQTFDTFVPELSPLLKGVSLRQSVPRLLPLDLRIEEIAQQAEWTYISQKQQQKLVQEHVERKAKLEERLAILRPTTPQKQTTSTSRLSASQRQPSPCDTVPASPVAEQRARCDLAGVVLEQISASARKPKPAPAPRHPSALLYLDRPLPGGKLPPERGDILQAVEARKWKRAADISRQRDLIAYKREKERRATYYKRMAPKTKIGSAAAVPAMGSLDMRRGETKQRLILELLALMERSSYDEANQIIDNLPAQLMQHADFLYLAGETKRAMGDLTAADRFLTAALRFQAHSPNVYLALARVRRASREYERAALLYEHYLQKNERADAHHEAALTFWQLGEKVKATIHVTRAIELSPDSAEYYATRGHFYERQKLFELGREDARRALERKPGIMDNLLVRAEQRLKAGDAVGAEQLRALVKSLVD